MPDSHIHLPPMPKPEDFGINEQTWSASIYPESADGQAALAKIDAYNRAVEAWSRAAKTTG